MKIIGHTKYGYIAEVSANEVGFLTGNRADARHDSLSGRSHPVGSDLPISESWEHLEGILRTQNQRKQIAESLRAAATLIEHTPDPLTLPVPEESNPSSEVAVS